MTETLSPIGFWSYARQDDEEKLSGLRSILQRQLQQKYGREPIKIFQDVAAIPPGADWNNKITEALHSSTFLIPIITPNFLESEWCNQEFFLFLEREAAIAKEFPELAASKRIFPIFYIDITDVEAFDSRLLPELRKRQWANFRDLIYKEDTHESVRLRLDQIAEGIVKVLRQDQRAIKERKIAAAAVQAAEPLAAGQRPAEEEAAAQKAAAEQKAREFESQRPTDFAEPRVREEAEAQRKAASERTEREAEAERQKAEPGKGSKSLLTTRNALMVCAALLAVIGITWMLVAHFHRHSNAPANSTATQPNSSGANPKAPPPPVVSHTPQFEAEEKAGLDAQASARFDEAQTHFENAVAIEPNNPQALLYAAVVAALQVTPNLESPENIKQNQHAMDLVNRLLELQPSDGFGLQILEVLYRFEEEFDRSNEVLEQILKIDPTDEAAQYTIGVNDWSVAYKTTESALETVGLHDDGQGYPKASLVVCLAIAARTGPVLADSIEHLNQALALNPNDDDAMSYLNLVYRLRAGTHCGDDAARKADIASADSYVQKATQIKIALEQQAPPTTSMLTPLPSNLTLPSSLASFFRFSRPYPPPPPPPRPPSSVHKR